MLESSTLYWLIVGILVIVTGCVMLVAYRMTHRGARQSSKEENSSEALKECAFFFGFLSERPTGKTIPEECLGCVRALSCMKTTNSPSKASKAHRLSLPETSTPEERTYCFGYLSQQPTGEPIPEKCWRCMRAMSCIAAAKPPGEDSKEKQVPIL